MKHRIYIFLLLVILSAASFAQGETTMLTAFRDFRPGVVRLESGQSIKQPFLNVFLKNSSLLYQTGSLTKEADMRSVAGVDFDDRRYVKMPDGMLAYVVDTVATQDGRFNALYCTELLDIEAYQQTMRNNVNITNLDISSPDLAGGTLNYTTISLEPQEGVVLPTIRKYHFLLGGEFVLVHERELLRKISKDKRRAYKTVISEKGFSWTDEGCLRQLLKTVGN